MWGPVGTAESTTSGDKLNLAGILNTLDGVVDTPGRLLVMTSNHPEKLDPALISVLPGFGLLYCQYCHGVSSCGASEQILSRTWSH